MLVSALEPLAKAASLGDEVSEYVDKCIAELKSESKIEQPIVNSLRGRLLELKKESIRRAIKRILNELNLNNKAISDEIDQAYSLRSQLIHNGVPDDLDIDLEAEYHSVSSIIRDIYAKSLNKKLLHENAG